MWIFSGKNNFPFEIILTLKSNVLYFDTLSTVFEATALNSFMCASPEKHILKKIQILNMAPIFLFEHLRYISFEM